MCFGSGGGDDVDQEAALKNREIEKLIRADQKKAAREVKLLLLGELNPSIPCANCYAKATSA
jgi:guanine nucleotide-binding protein subunit alpha